MITVHHLRVGRSIFCVWQLEEFGLDYELKVYHRNPETRRAPPELRDIHPLGKSPVIEIDGMVMAESGAITSYLLETRDPANTLSPPRSDHQAWAIFTQWLHYTEGSAFLPLFLRLLRLTSGQESPVFDGFAVPEVKLHLTYMTDGLGDKQYILGDDLSAADFGFAYITSMAERLGELGPYPKLQDYINRIRERPAWKRAIDRAVE